MISKYNVEINVEADCHLKVVETRRSPNETDKNREKVRMVRGGFIDNPKKNLTLT